jgi:hypothetical protein
MQNRGMTGTGDRVTGAGVRVTGSPAHPGLEVLEGSCLARQTLSGMCASGVYNSGASNTGCGHMDARKPTERRAGASQTHAEARYVWECTRYGATEYPGRLFSPGSSRLRDKPGLFVFRASGKPRTAWAEVF